MQLLKVLKVATYSNKLIQRDLQLCKLNLLENADRKVFCDSIHQDHSIVDNTCHGTWTQWTDFREKNFVR